MKEILFIVPPNIRYDDYVAPASNVKVTQKKGGKFGAIITDMPLGVLSLSAYVKKYAAAHTRLVDFNVVFNRLEDFNFKSFFDFFDDFFVIMLKSNWHRTLYVFLRYFLRLIKTCWISHISVALFGRTLLLWLAVVYQLICIDRYLVKVRILTRFVLVKEKGLF